MGDEFFYVTQWANAYMYIISSVYMPMYVLSLNEDFIIIIIIIIIIMPVPDTHIQSVHSSNCYYTSKSKGPWCGVLAQTKELQACEVPCTDLKCKVLEQTTRALLTPVLCQCVDIWWQH